MKKRTIYTLMNEIHTIRMSIILAYQAYKNGKKYYITFEDKATASLNTLLDVDYITTEEYKELADQMYHIFKIYKRH